MNSKPRYSAKVIDEDIVISGMSGRFPESDSIDEYAQNLYSGADMISGESRRWPTDLYGMDPHMGQLKSIDKLDVKFFGLMDKMGHNIDPQSRILLETTYEAIVDSGINPSTLRGSKTGVYIGCSTFGTADGVPEETQPDSENSVTDSILWLQGSGFCLYANRVSFVFDFNGPSLVTETACSASCVALNIAMNDLRLGRCDQAIVGGTHINLQPFSNHIFQSIRLNPSDGVPRVWDEKADGFVRGETVGCLFLQRASAAKRIYATVLNSGVNIDGNKRMGMFYPSAEAQEDLMIQVYKEANVDPLEVQYVEAHATGTKVGDIQEAKAIYQAFCHKPKREGTINIGLLKSVIGHAEGASGVSSIAKVLLSYENECIPANKNLEKLKSVITDMCPPMVPIMENMKYTPGIACVNNIGVGGVNANVLLEPNYKIADEDCLKIADTIPRIVNLCCRTEEAFSQMCKWIEDNPQKVTRDFLALLTETMKFSPLLNSAGFPYRGTLFIREVKTSDNQTKYEYKKQHSICIDKTVRPVWFLFAGLGGQWIAMAKALMPIKIFADKIEECHQILAPYGVDLKHLLLSDDKDSMSTMTNKFCATTALEIALFEVLKALDIIPDGIIGHSFGEIAAAYADGCLTTDEALFVSYIRGKITESDKRVPKGLMAAVGMSWEEMKKLCPKGVSVVCNNGKDSVVVSGTFSETQELVKSLAEKGVFVRELQSNDVPYHSEYLLCCAQHMIDEIKKYIPNPKLRSKKWISTSVLENDPKTELLYASAEYFVQNLISPVYFYNRLKHMPLDAIVVEIGPHGLFSKIITQTLETSNYISLLKRDSNDTNLEMFLSSFARLYELGLNPSINKLYPKVEWPVARGTQSIGSLIRWDHNKSYSVRGYPDYKHRETSSDFNETVDIANTFKNFFPDHKIDENVIFPAAGYLLMAWKRLAYAVGRLWYQITVIFEDVQFRRPVFLSYEEPTKLKVRFLKQSGEFFILENNNICCFGKMRTTDEYSLYVQDLIQDNNNIDEKEVILEESDIYKDLKVCGYDYGLFFRRLKTLKTKDFIKFDGTVEWEGNWITFMDGLLQTMAVTLPYRKLVVPVMIKRLTCDLKVFNAKQYELRVRNRNEEQQRQEEWRDFEDTIEEMEETDEMTELLRTENLQVLDKMISDRFHIQRSVIPFHLDMDSKIIATHGIELECVEGIPIPRKLNFQNLKLESYQFIANEDLNAIEENDWKRVLDYQKVCTKLTDELKRSIEANENISMDETYNKYFSDIKEDQILLKILSHLFNELRDGKQKSVETGKLITDSLKKPEFDMSLDMIHQFSKNEYLIRSLLDIVSENNVPKKEIKVLEINQTNGLMAKEVDNHLASFHIYPIDVDYTIAVKPMGSVSEDLKEKSFKMIEWNPKESNFPSDVIAKDLIIMKDSHDLWDLKLDSYIEEIYDSLIDKGFLLSVFRYKYTDPELTLNSMNGKKQMNSSELEQRISDFVKTAEKIGLKIVGHKSDSICYTSVLFRKVANPVIPSKNNIIELKTNFYEWFESLKEKLIQLKESEEKENLWLIANDSSNNGIIGLINCLRLEPGGEAIRCLFDIDHLTKFPINFNEKPFSDILTNDLAINVLKNGKSGTYRHLTLPEDYDKIESNEYFLNISQTRDLSGLQWFDLKNLKSPEIYYSISDNSEIKQIECNVYISGLNFRDVMLATGRIVAGPQALFTDCLLGFEFAGRRCDTGERVVGFDGSRCFSTSVCPSEVFISKIPDHWSMEEAVTVLCTYSTVWYGLIERAQMKKNESILIHSGAGGVGQAAINICKYYDCDIFVTVGTDDKKKFLMNEYNIPENRIFSSRDIQFKFKIKELTKGKGVDLVLNSLAGDKLDASFECVANCGRFVEIGKFDLQMNKQLGMFSFLRDISFIGVSVDQQLFQNNNAPRFFDWMQENSTNGMIKPINRTVFSAEDADKAFRYMTTGKHIGKILIKIRDEENQKVLKNMNPSNKLIVTTKTYFNPNKVYIITGGLGGFGIELVHWMLFAGARKFVLTSRQGVKNAYQKYTLGRLEALGEKLKCYAPEIVVSTQDTKTICGTTKLIKEAQQLGPIGGVFHLALVINDSFFENQTYDKFTETVDSKIKVFDNMNELTRDMKLDLDYFVVFSSVSCGKGNAGQSNYGYANSICEHICEGRRKDGLHGLAIQWGPIGDVGLLSDTDIHPMAGVKKQRINSCFETLDKLLQTKQSVVSCYVRAERLIQSGTKEAKVVAQIWSQLGVDPNKTPDHLNLGEIGMESIFAVELQEGLERDYGIKIGLTDVKFITIKLLKDFEAGRIHELKIYSEELKISRSKLCKYKFIIPTETHTRLNAVKTGKPIYLLPPIDGIFASLEPLAEKIRRPVIGLNWIRDLDKMTSIKEIYGYFMNLLKTLSPKEDYDMMGTLDNGGLMIIKMLPKAQIGKALLIDCISELNLDEKILTDEEFLVMSLKSFWKTLPEPAQEKFQRDLRSNKDFETKVSKLVTDIREFGGKSLMSKDLDEIIKNSIKRAKMLTNYRQNMKKKFNKMKYKIGQKYLEAKGKLLIIKPSEYSDSLSDSNRFTDLYFLPEQELADRIKLEHIDEIAEEFCSDEVAQKVNQYFSSK